VALQILQQRDALFEPLQILGHGAVVASRVERRRKAGRFPGKDGGRQFSQSRKGQNRARKGNTVCQRNGNKS
jgi:hypothetical protein